MAQIWINNVSVSLGAPLLLDGASLAIEAGERIGLLGRNGAGKSTLLKMLHGEIRPDAGDIVKGTDVRVALLPQEVPETLPGTVYDIVASGGQGHLDLLHQYHELTMRLAHGDDAGAAGAKLLSSLEQLQHKLETSGAWHFHQRVEQVISWASLDEDAEFGLLSAGLKRRVLLAKALADQPDVLLLDEPTNHLDIDAILWLEDFLLRFAGTLVFVTHDRAFLQRIATKIVEIDRGRLLSFDCDYPTYLERRQSMLDAEEKNWQDFDKKLAQEEVWIRQGIKARRTRNEGRVRALEQLRVERALRRERMGNAQIAIVEATRSGRLVAEAKDVSFAYDGGPADGPDARRDAAPIVDRLSTAIIRGDRVGILGPNGSGKTTLLKLLLGELEPQQGRVRLGASLKIAYFDQLRAQLDDDRPLRQSVADGGDTVVVQGKSRHVVGYLQDWLFSPEQIQAPVRLLSGGERNRLLLARLFSVPSNVLVLDEPTNDLDTETLALLEERLLTYSGTILLVSHDRAFLNNVVTSTLVFESTGRLREYAGGYDDWLRQRKARRKTQCEPAASRAPKATTGSPAARAAAVDAAVDAGVDAGAGVGARQGAGPTAKAAARSGAARAAAPKAHGGPNADAARAPCDAGAGEGDSSLCFERPSAERGAFSVRDSVRSYVQPSVRKGRGVSQRVSGGTCTSPPAASAPVAAGAGAPTGARPPAGTPGAPSTAPPRAKRKLSYKENKELEALPQRIEALEQERDQIGATLSSSEFYATNDSSQVAATNARLAAVQHELAEAFERWAALEGLEGLEGL